MNQSNNFGILKPAAIFGLIIAAVALAAWYSRADFQPAPAIEVTPVESPTEVSAAPSATPGPLPPTATVSATPKPATPTSTATLTPTPAPVIHIIKSGEMLLTIAADNDTTVEEIMAANPAIDPTNLQIGQELLIPVTPTPVLSSGPTTPPQPTPELVFETLQAGDTLLALSLKFDIPVDLILMVNPMLNPNNLQIGQKVLIPPADGDILDPIVWAPQIDYAVQSGDTLLAIALANGSSMEDILAVNPDLEPTSLLQIGQMLKVPQTRPRPQNGTGGGSVSTEKLVAAPSLSAADVAALKSGSPTLVGLEEKMVNAVNAERAAAGLPPYAVSADLTTMAWSQAHDMVTRSYFSHITPEGLALRDRFRARNITINWVGENIYLSVKPADQAVASTIAWFMGDAPHRRNILHPNFTRMGVGVAQGESGWYTFVLDFAGD